MKRGLLPAGQHVVQVVFGQFELLSDRVFERTDSVNFTISGEFQQRQHYVLIVGKCHNCPCGFY